MRAISRHSRLAVLGILIWAAPVFARFTITTVAGGKQALEGDCEAGPAIRANITPYGEFLDSAGNFHIAEGQNLTRKVSQNGIITTVAGGEPGGSLGDGAPATSASLFSPTGVVLDSAGDSYLADSGSGRVRKV